MGSSVAPCRCANDVPDDAIEADQVLAVSDADQKLKAAQKEKAQDAKKKLGALATSVHNRASKPQTEAWKKVESEYNVQKMIWQSLAMQRGAAHQGISAAMQSKLDYALSCHATDLPSALEALEACLDKNKEADILGASMKDAMAAVKTSLTTVDARKELSKVLKEASKAASAPAIDLPKMLADGKLEDPKLELSIKTAWKAAFDE
eukprot:TRINITY_DN61306_c0_g1_i1.p1 TRINITY_DN61306_c0_g1~~TRINITY_DN61306_c0_g1_i1.p1  ORF type:complete len:216 (+),score=54.56 TRINITY_DN61306_c0_g1_i1:32-649(+)